MEMPVPWREMLGRIIHDTSERQRIAQILGVSPVTLMRWANNTSSPRPQNLQHLLQAVPEYRNSLLELILEEFPDFITTPNEESAECWGEIPSSFYAHAIRAFATTPKMQRF